MIIMQEGFRHAVIIIDIYISLNCVHVTCTIINKQYTTNIHFVPHIQFTKTNMYTTHKHAYSRVCYKQKFKIKSIIPIKNHMLNLVQKRGGGSMIRKLRVDTGIDVYVYLTTNRHVSGKKMGGILVKSEGELTSYPYPLPLFLVKQHNRTNMRIKYMSMATL